MKLKRVLAVLLALCMILPLAACADKGDAAATTTAADTATTTTANNEVPDEGNQGTPDATTTVTDKDGNVVTTTTTVVTDKDGNVVTTTTEKGASATTTRPSKSMASGGNIVVTNNNNAGNTMGQAITIKEGDTPCEAGITNFNGATFTYAYYGTSWNEKQEWRFQDFQKKYNVKIDIRALPSGEYVSSLSAAMAAGTPYDMVFLHGFDYPSQITANVMLPLNDYITTADLWTEESVTKGGFSYSLMQATSLNGNVYCIAGNYLNTPATVYYNKKIFADAGFDGENDPMQLYKDNKWTWEKLYDMLSDIQDPDSGLYGMNSISPYYDHQFLCSYGTDLAKLKANGTLAQNLGDPQLYKAFEMLKKYSFGEHRVTDPNNPFENGQEQFLNGTTATMIGNIGYYGTFTDRMDEKTYSAFGSKAQQKSNLGCVPMPISNSEGLHPIWYWIGYGAGNGTTAEGVKFVLTFVKHDSIYNQGMTFDPTVMPAELCTISRNIMDDDKLIGPMGGFETSAGSLGGTETTLSSQIALKGANVTVTLKAYERKVQTIIDQALA